MSTRLRIAIVIGIFAISFAIGFIGTALAGELQSYWKQDGATYSCQGYKRASFCTETNWRKNYKVAIIPGRIMVSYGQNVIFSCNRSQTPLDNCIYFGP